MPPLPASGSRSDGRITSSYACLSGGNPAQNRGQQARSPQALSGRSRNPVRGTEAGTESRSKTLKPLLFDRTILMPDVQELRINGKTVRGRRRSRASAARRAPRRPGPDRHKYGCGEGRCGACTVLIDGARSARASPSSAPSPRTRSPPSRAWRRMESSTRSSKPSSTPVPCSVRIAPAA